MAMIHVDLDEQSSILEVDAWLRQKWHDDFLTWDPADYKSNFFSLDFCNICQ